MSEIQSFLQNKQIDDVLINIHKSIEQEKISSEMLLKIVNDCCKNARLSLNDFKKQYKNSNYFLDMTHYNSENITDYSKIISSKEKFKAVLNNQFEQPRHQKKKKHSLKI